VFQTRSRLVVATNRLAGGFMASPAADGKALYLRTKDHYRVEAKASGQVILERGATSPKSPPPAGT
jgi:hypothetical protein